MSDFIFCPRCGAVTKPGVCTNCGYTINKEENEKEEAVNETSDYNSESVPLKDNSKPKSSKGWIIGLVIGLAVIAITILLIVVIAAFIIVPIVFKTVYTAQNINQIITTPSPYSNPPISPSIDIDDDDDDDDDADNDPDVGVDNGTIDPDIYDPSSDESYYATKIEPLYAGTSKFDYDKFMQDIVPNANEYWDESAEDTFDYYINGSYTSYLKSEVSHGFIERDGFETPYYEYLIDSYIENENYDVERRLIRYEGTQNGIFVNAYCAYYTLSSDTVDYTDANEALRNQALSMLYNFLSKNVNSSESFNYTLYTDAVITFNNDEILSVGYSSTSYLDNNLNDFSIHGVNIDVKKGKAMDNTAILNFDDDFSEFFVKRSNIQNSFVDSINNSNASDITKLFKDDDSLILLFTPLGIEVGINYRYQYSFGWVTVTINDYDTYFSNQYSFDTSYGHIYDMYQYEKDNGITYDGFDSPDGVDYYDL